LRKGFQGRNWGLSIRGGCEARVGVESGLLKCRELDTLTMVMIFETWRPASSVGV